MMRKKKKLALIALLLLFILSAFIYLFFNIKEIKIIDMKVNVSDRIGFDVTTSYLNFGNVPPGSSSKRTIVIKNHYDFDIALYILVFGKIKNYVKIDKPFFIIKPDEKKGIDITVKVPVDAEKQEMRGKAVIIIRRI